MSRIIRRYTRHLMSGAGVETVQVVWCTERYRYEIQDQGDPVPGFPQSIHPPKLYRFLAALAWDPVGPGSWDGHLHGMSSQMVKVKGRPGQPKPEQVHVPYSFARPHLARPHQDIVNPFSVQEYDV